MNRTIHTLSTSRTALILLLATLLTATTAQGAWAQEAITGLTYNSTDGYYEISDAQDLVDLANYVNAGNNASGKTFKQTDDITLTSNFFPIGKRGGDEFFSGNYDGGNYMISGLTISEEKGYLGLFGSVGYDASHHATVKNVVLVSPSVTATDNGSLNADVGTVVGYCEDGGTVDNCIVINPTVNVSGTNKVAGAIVGNLWLDNNTATNCYFYDSNAGHNYNAIGYIEPGCTVTNVARTYMLTLGSGVTTSTAAAFTYGNTSYYAGTVTLAAAPDGWIYDYSVNGSAISGNAFSIAADATVSLTRTPDPAHFSQSGDEYTINTAAGWNVFCDCLNDNDTYNRFSGKTVRLGADITVTRMAGGDSHDFTGTFNGGGHTLTFSHTATDNYCAPFRHVQGASAETPAVIRNLNVVSTVTAADFRHPAGLIALQSGHVSVTDCNVEAHINCTKGTANPSDLYPAALVSQSNDTGVLTVSGCTTTGQIATDGKYAAGLIGIVQNTAAIENCRVSVTIQSTTSGDGTHGGLVASQPSNTTITITGCLFDGRLLGSATSSCGGFIGWRNSTATIYNSLFAPAEVTVQNSGSATFARNTVDTYNCYYTTLLNDGTQYAPALADGTVSPAKWHNGKATRTVTAAADVTIGAVALTGDATQYTVSGITAYSGGGLQLGETLYYGSDDQLRLTLSKSATGAPLGYLYDGYTASAGTLSGTTLTMPDEDVTISTALAPIDWATVNKGDSKYPYMIYNKDQLLLLAHRVNGTNGETANDYQGKYFKLGADITFDPNDLTLDEEQSNYEAIGGYIGGYTRYFNGKFDGDGHTVSGIRICKDGTGDADFYQGLFGQIGSHANIHDVHLTDAHIKGYYYVGGIVGFNTGNSIVSGCTVTNSHITATGEYYGTICGFNADGTLRNNYYHGCTVNSTAVTSGKGCEGADIADDNGALPAYAITLGDGVSTTVLASEPENGFVKGGISYYRLGLALPLASEAPEGYTLSFSAKGTALSGNTYTVNATDGDVTINTALRSDGLEHEVNYMTADGTTQTAKAIALDGHEAVGEDGNVHLAAGTYYVGTDIAYANLIWLDGDVTLILANGKTMTLNGNTMGISGGYNLTITIYGQSLDAATAGTLRYDGTLHGIDVSNYEQHSGNVSITTTNSRVSGIIADVTLRGGTLTTSADGIFAYAINGQMHSILGGHLTATATGTDATGIRAAAADGTVITLGWTRPDDRITASSISTGGGTVAVTTGQALTDGSGNIYTGTLTAADLAALAGKTLQPWLVLNETNGVTPLTALAGQTNVPVIFTRTFSANVASTICLPFAISAEQAAAAGKFYTFAGVDTSDSEWVVTMQETNATNAALAANTPYLFMPSASREVTFSGTIGNVADTSAGTTNSGVWTYQGTYETIEWTTDPVNIYGFASGQAYGNSDDQTAAGKFIRVHTGGIRPFRAYLKYAPSASGARALSRSANDGLPETMTVRLIGSNGQTTAIGTLDTRTGEATFDADSWYTLDGRRLSGQPTAKGIYIYKGKKVIIK